MATRLITDKPGCVEYRIYGHPVGYEAKADLTDGVLMWAQVTDLEARVSEGPPLGLSVAVPTTNRDVLDSLAVALDNHRSIRVTVEWE